jgi:hypothetical protein
MQFRQVRGRISALVDLHATSGSIPVFLEQTLDDPMIYGKWVHVAMSWDIVNGVMQFWVNNELIRSAFGERNFSTNRITTDVCKMRVGAGYSPAERFLNGYVDCFGVWNRVLSNAEVGDLYYTGFGRQYPFSYPRQA